MKINDIKIGRYICKCGCGFGMNITSLNKETADYTIFVLLNNMVQETDKSINKTTLDFISRTFDPLIINFISIKI